MTSLSAAVVLLSVGAVVAGLTKFAVTGLAECAVLVGAVVA